MHIKAVLLAGVSAFLLWQSSFSQEANIPSTLAELNQWYAEPPAGQNAAAKFLEGIAALKVTAADRNSTDLPVIGTQPLPPDKSVSPATKSAVAAFVERNEPAIALFKQGALLQQSRYPIDLNQGLMTLTPHLLGIKHSAQVLELAAISHALAGQGAEAGDDLLISLALARSVEAEPFLISQLVRVACGTLLTDGFEQTLNRVTLSSQTLDRLQKSLAQSEGSEAAGFGFDRALVSERVIGLSLFNQPPEQLLKDLPSELKPQEPTIRKNLAADRQHFETTFEQVTSARTRAFPSRLDQNDIFRKAALEATNRSYFISKMLLPALPVVGTREAANLARLRLVQTAVALERFRFAHAGRYPESLTGLTPNYLSAVPTDPFDGKNLRYRQLGNGYIVYSIDRDLRDDGGKRTNNQQEGDLVIRVLNRP